MTKVATVKFPTFIKSPWAVVTLKNGCLTPDNRIDVILLKGYEEKKVQVKRTGSLTFVSSQLLLLQLYNRCCESYDG